MLDFISQACNRHWEWIYKMVSRKQAARSMTDNYQVKAIPTKPPFYHFFQCSWKLPSSTILHLDMNFSLPSEHDNCGEDVISIASAYAIKVAAWFLQFWIAEVHRYVIKSLKIYLRIFFSLQVAYANFIICNIAIPLRLLTKKPDSTVT